MTSSKSTPLSACLRSGAAVVALSWGVLAAAQTASPTAGESAAAPEAAVAAAADTAVPGDIVVTGSRIRGVAPVGSPLIEQNRTDLISSGATTTTQLVQNLPQVINQGVTESNRNTTGGAGNITYSSGFNIRGIGPYATLTLLNGHRIVESGSSGGLPDPSAIPTIAIQRVEVVADGASAIYGSDAVAGVVNLITRRRFDGIEARAQYGIARGNDYNPYNLGIIGGVSWASGNITAAFERSGHRGLSSRDRAFTAADLRPRGGGDYRNNQCNPANIVINGVSYALPALAANTVNRCDTYRDQDLIPAQKRDSVMGAITQELGDRITLTGDILYTKRDFTRRVGQTTATVEVPNTNPYFRLPPGVVATSETVQTAFGGQAPRNDATGYSKILQGTAGLNVKLFGDFQLDASYTYGRDKSYSLTTRGINNGALFEALASTNPATALNPFGPNSQAVLDSVFSDVFGAPGLNKLHQGEVGLSGTLARLPGGDLKIAVGGDYLRQTITTGLDGGTIGNLFAIRVNAKRTVKSVFGELRIPIFGPDNATPGFEGLDISLAGRISDYSDVGTSKNPKIGVNWAPVDGIKLHGSFGKSFRAPLLTQITGPINALFVQNYQTPNGIVTGAALSSIAGGNPLTPEKATTWSFGVDLAPRAMPQLRASLNYFNIDYTGQINAVLSDPSILSSAAAQAQYADRIVQGPAAAAVIQQFIAAGYPVFGVLPANPTLFVYGQNINAGKTKAEGVDFQLSYQLDNLSFSTAGTYFTKYRTAVSTSAPLLDTLNRIYNPPRFRSRSSVGWNDGGTSAILFWNFTNTYRNDRVAPAQKVSSYSTFDLHLAQTIEGGLTDRSRLTVALDVQNLFDKNPPFVDIPSSPNGGGGYDATAASPLGRVISVSATVAL